MPVALIPPSPTDPRWLAVAPLREPTGPHGPLPVALGLEELSTALHAAKLP